MLGTQQLGNIVLGQGNGDRYNIEDAFLQAISDVVGPDVVCTYSRRPQSRADLPCVILVSRDDEERIKPLGAKTTVANYRWSTVVYDLDEENVKAIGELLVQQFDHFKGEMKGRNIRVMWMEDGTSDESTPANDGMDHYVFGVNIPWFMRADD